MKRVLITGAAGFLGSHLAERFLKDGYAVIGMDNLITGSLKNIEPFQDNPNFTFVNHDVSKHIEIDGQLDYVLHFASPASPIDYLKIPIQTLKVGSLGIHNCLGLAKAKGARVMAGGARGNKGYFYQPTVLADVPLEANVMSNEPFGPLALIRPFGSFDEAIEQANRLPYGLAAFAFTENGRQANLLGDALESGMVGINTFAISVPDAPFGGVKESGFGSEGGPEGLDSYLVTKAIHQA